MTILKKINIILLVAIKIYLVVPLIFKYPLQSLIIFSILVLGFIINLVRTTMYLPKVSNATIFYVNIDYPNNSDYDSIHEDQELGELINVFTLEYVNPKEVDVSIMVLPYKRVNIFINHLTNFPVKYVSESSFGYNSEKLDSEIEIAIKIYKKKNDDGLNYFVSGNIEVFKGSDGEINIALDLEEI